MVQILPTIEDPLGDILVSGIQDIGDIIGNKIQQSRQSRAIDQILSESKNAASGDYDLNKILQKGARNPLIGLDRAMKLREQFSKERQAAESLRSAEKIAAGKAKGDPAITSAAKKMLQDLPADETKVLTTLSTVNSLKPLIEKGYTGQYLGGNLGTVAGLFSDDLRTTQEQIQNKASNLLLSQNLTLPRLASEFKIVTGKQVYSA